MQGQAEVFVDAQPFEEQEDTQHADYNKYCHLCTPEEAADSKDEHHKSDGHQNGLCMLWIVKDLFDNIVGALKVWHLVDNHALDACDRDP